MALGMHMFRKHQGKLLLTLGVTLMVAWLGGGMLTRMFSPGDYAGRAFGEKVTNAELRGSFNALRLLGKRRDVSEDEAWAYLVMQKEADRLRIKVSEDEVTETIRQWVESQVRDTNADPDMVYAAILKETGYGDNAVRYIFRRQLAVGKLQQMVAAAYQPPDWQLWRQYAEMMMKVRLKRLAVPAEPLEAGVPLPTAEEVASYFEERKAGYVIPAKATVEYAALLDADVERIVPVTEDEIEEYYEKNKVEEYLLPLEEQDLGEAEEAGGDTAAGEETAGGQEPQPLEAAYRPLAEVRDEIRRKLLGINANSLLSDVFIDYRLPENDDLKMLAEKYGLSYFKLPALAADEVDGLGPLSSATGSDNVPVTDEIFAPADRGGSGGGELRSAESPGGNFLYRVALLTEARQAELAEIKEQVEADLVASRALDVAMEKAGEILDDVKANGWKTYEEDAAYNVQETELTNTLPVAGLMEAAMGIEGGGFGAVVRGDDAAHVFQVLEIDEPGIEEFDRGKGYLKLWASYSQRQAFVGRWQADLVERAGIEIRNAPEEEPERAGEPAPLL